MFGMISGGWASHRRYNSLRISLGTGTIDVELISALLAPIAAFSRKLHPAGVAGSLVAKPFFSRSIAKGDDIGAP
jgi:hypothetical protein